MPPPPSCQIGLTLPVRRYLVPTPSTKRGNVSRPPMIPETADFTTLNFCRPLGLSMRGKKTGGVVDLSLVKFPWQLFCLRVFSTKFY